MKEYRQNSHTFSLAFWALLCTATAVVLFVHSHKIVNRVLKTEEILGGVALLIFGPIALALYLIRARRVWVSVDHLRGVVVSGRRTIAWSDILRLERHRPSFRRTSGPVEVASPRFRGLDAAPGCIDVGCLAGIGEMFLAVILIIAAVFLIELIFVVLIPLIFIPILEVFAPFGDRITVVTRRGRIVLRDLRDADEFEQQVRSRLNA